MFRLPEALTQHLRSCNSFLCLFSTGFFVSSLVFLSLFSTCFFLVSAPLLSFALSLCLLLSISFHLFLPLFVSFALSSLCVFIFQFSCYLCFPLISSIVVSYTSVHLFSLPWVFFLSLVYYSIHIYPIHASLFYTCFSVQYILLYSRHAFKNGHLFYSRGSAYSNTWLS